jgi:hypothetical protein
MKKHTPLFFSTTLCIFASLLLMFACTHLNPLEGVVLTVNTDIYKSPIIVRALNADAQATVQPTEAVVVISGQDAQLVVDDLGNKDVKMANGILTLNLLPEANPSITKPIVFNVYVSCPGFVSSNQTISVTDAQTPLKIYVPMVSLANPPDGVTVVQQTANLSGGVANTTTVITAPAGNGKTETAVISIPMGTQIQDANGTPINANAVSVQMTHFGTTAQESIESFPGGFMAENAISSTGEKQPITFETAGFVAIDMEAGGKAVKKFSTPIDVSIGVSSTLVNPTTKENIKEGDSVPVWSLNSETGEWKEEGLATIIKGKNGELTASFKASHLSWWNLDWWYSNCTRGTSLTINVKSNLTKQQAVYPYEVQLQTTSGQYLAGLHSQEMYEGLSFTIPRMPSISQAKIVVYSTKTWQIVGKTELFSPCNKGSIQVSITETPPPAPINLDIDFTAKCSNKQVNIKPSQWVYFLEQTAGGSSWKYGYLNGGRLSLQVLEGAQYYIYAYYGNNIYSGIGKFSKTGSSFVPFGISGLTGSISFNVATNTATLTTVYTSTSCK